MWLRGQKQIAEREFEFSVRSASIAAGYIPRAQVTEKSAVVKARREARGSSSGIDPLASWDLEKTDSESETEITLPLPTLILIVSFHLC